MKMLKMNINSYSITCLYIMVEGILCQSTIQYSHTHLHTHTPTHTHTHAHIHTYKHNNISNEITPNSADFYILLKENLIYNLSILVSSRSILLCKYFNFSVSLFTIYFKPIFIGF